MFHGRIPYKTPVGDLLPVKSPVILPGRIDHTVMLRLVGLNYHLAGLFPAARPARCLCQKLKRALPRPVIISVQRKIRRQHSHQCHARKVVSLHDHLGSHKNIRLLIRKGGKNPLVAVLPAGGVRVHAQHPGTRKFPVNGLLHLLGPGFEPHQIWGSTGRTLRRLPLLIPTVMAGKHPVSVLRQGHIAVGTFHHMTTGAAGDKPGIASSV